MAHYEQEGLIEAVVLAHVALHTIQKLDPGLWLTSQNIAKEATTEMVKVLKKARIRR